MSRVKSVKAQTTDIAGVNAGEVIDRYKVALEISTDIELAKFLKLSNSTIPQWRQRNKVPYEYLTKVSAYSGRTIDWLIFGKEHHLPAPDAILTGISQTAQKPVASKNRDKAFYCLIIANLALAIAILIIIILTPNFPGQNTAPGQVGENRPAATSLQTSPGSGPLILLLQGRAVWSARAAHNHEVAGSNPAPATNSRNHCDEATMLLHALCGGSENLPTALTGRFLPRLAGRVLPPCRLPVRSFGGLAI